MGEMGADGTRSRDDRTSFDRFKKIRDIADRILLSKVSSCAVAKFLLSNASLFQTWSSENPCQLAFCCIQSIFVFVFFVIVFVFEFQAVFVPPNLKLDYGGLVPGRFVLQSANSGGTSAKNGLLCTSLYLPRLFGITMKILSNNKK